MELRRNGITFMSAQDLQAFHHEHSGFSSGDDQLNIYELVHFFMQHHPDGYYFLDEVPLIQGGMKSLVISFVKSIFKCKHLLTTFSNLILFLFLSFRS